MTLTWDVEPGEAMLSVYDEYERVQREAVLEVALYFAPLIEAWMKQNAPWEDKTGNLRQSLHAEVDQLVDSIVINFDYGLNYGAFLEFAHAGKYAIIGPALDFWTVEIVATLREIGLLVTVSTERPTP